MIDIITDKKLKKDICENILRDLPEWFGIETATAAYIEGVEDKFFIAHRIDKKYIGFACLENTSDISCDMYVLGVLKAYHKSGIGSELVLFLEKEALKMKKSYITVKTLSDRSPDINYKKTREFYYKNGYKMIEEFRELWDEYNPCAYMIKPLALDSILDINDNLRLRRIEKSDYKSALKWYQNKKVLKYSENITDRVYDIDTINEMYNYLSSKGELFFIEVFEDYWKPIGDVTLSELTMPIAIGDTSYWNRGIGKTVINYLLNYAKLKGYPVIKLNGIYKFNERSLNLYRNCGFKYLDEDKEKIYMGINLEE